MSGAISGQASATGEAVIVSNFAYTHYSAAILFRDKTNENQASNLGQQGGNILQEMSIFCSSCIISSVATIETLINELYLTPGPLQNSLPNFDEAFWGGVREKRVLFFKYKSYKAGLERKNALEKYKKAIRLLGRGHFDRRDENYRKVELLIGLRNYLIHFKPLWDENRRLDRLENELAGLFDLSPFVDEGADFLAKKCMSAGCANWAVETTTSFISEFRAKSNIFQNKLGVFES